MTAIVTEIVVLLLLVIANGVFAMTEIAIVSARKGRLRSLAEIRMNFPVHPLAGRAIYLP